MTPDAVKNARVTSDSLSYSDLGKNRDLAASFVFFHQAMLAGR